MSPFFYCKKNLHLLLYIYETISKCTNRIKWIDIRSVSKVFKGAKKKLVIIKSGDHSLSSTKYLSQLKKELKLIIN